MSSIGSVQVMQFSREMRRRTQQSQRSGRGPNTPGNRQPPARGGCCVLIILFILGIWGYAMLYERVLKPKVEKKKSSARPSAMACAPVRPAQPVPGVKF